MIWTIIVSAVLVAGAFIGIYVQTGNTWSALNAAGMIAGAGFVVVIFQLVRKPIPQKFRWSIVVGSAVILIGTGYHWVTMYRMSHWQYDTLHLVHKVVHHGIAMELLSKQGTAALNEYYGQKTKRMSLGEAFKRNTSFVQADSGIVQINTDAEAKLMVASASDSEVVLIVQSNIRIDGEDPAFRNFDGQTGAVQDRLRITRKGMSYELQN